MAQHPHLIIPTTAEPSRFTSPSSGPRERMNLPTRSRAEHAQNLISTPWKRFGRKSRFFFPQPDVSTTWEVWLRRHSGIDHLARLRGYAEHFHLTVGGQAITFVDRSVVLVTGTANDLSRSVEILGMIAEVRMPKTPAAFFTEMTAVEQQEWIDELVSRIVPPGAG